MKAGNVSLVINDHYVWVIFSDFIKQKARRSELFKCGWGTRIRTSECRNQNPVPYRLAIPQQIGF